MDMARFFFNSDTITLNLLPVAIAGLALTLGKHIYFVIITDLPYPGLLPLLYLILQPQPATAVSSAYTEYYQAEHHAAALGDVHNDALAAYEVPIEAALDSYGGSYDSYGAHIGGPQSIYTPPTF
jgi:hypothetical protein